MRPVVKLDTLIDDCILKIADYLSPVDVVNLASTCARFFVLAGSKIFPQFVKVRLASTCCKKIEDKTITKELLDTMMLHFGATVQHIELNNLVFACSYLKIVLEKCPRLHTLNITRHVFTKEEIEIISKSNVSTNIRVLILNFCKNVKAFNTLTIFPKLRAVKLNFIQEEVLLRHDVLPNLTKLELRGCDFRSKSELKSNFELMGLNMRSLKLVGGEYNQMFAIIAPLITMKLKNIESLTISIESNVSSLLCLTELNHLKDLKIFGICCCINVTELLNKLSARGRLERLELNGGTYWDNFPQFEKLRRLRLNPFHITSNNLHGARNMPLVTHLWIGKAPHINDKMLVALYAFKKSLIEMQVTNEEGIITFSAIKQIIDYLRYRGADRPHLKLTIKPFKLRKAEVISNPIILANYIFYRFFTEKSSQL